MDTCNGGCNEAGLEKTDEKDLYECPECHSKYIHDSNGNFIHTGN